MSRGGKRALSKISNQGGRVVPPIAADARQVPLDQVNLACYDLLLCSPFLPCTQMIVIRKEVLSLSRKTRLKFSVFQITVYEAKTIGLLVSGRSPECSDCLLRFYGAVITLKN